MDTTVFADCYQKPIPLFSQKILFQSVKAWMLDEMPDALQKATCFAGDVLDPQTISSPTLFCLLPALGLQESYARLLQHHTSHPATPICICQKTNQPNAPLLLAIWGDAQTITQKKLWSLPFSTLQKQASILWSTDSVWVLQSVYDLYHYQKKIALDICFYHMERGVHILSPDTTLIDPKATIGVGTTLMPNTLLRGQCIIGAHCTIGPNALIEDSTIGDETQVNASQVFASSIGKKGTVGPFAYIRPQCTIGDNARIGDFVELKKATIGNGTKVSHLTYIGDATVGERVNFGCGTVVVNYDGYTKSQTVVGDDCFIGCNTNLVAPVTLGNRVFTAAGTTVTSDVPDGALTVARARQKDILGWNDKRRKQHETQTEEIAGGGNT